jgi:gamma-glutamylputrescine oxidase
LLHGRGLLVNAERARIAREVALNPDVYPPSFYAVHRAIEPERTPLTGRHEAETVVVGGGLAGITVAWSLARAGRQVIVMESRRVGWGASGRNGGAVLPGFSQSKAAIERAVGLAHARQLHDLSRRGLLFVHERLTELGLMHLIGGRGGLLAIRHDRLDDLRRRQRLMARHYGVRLALWDRDALRETLVTDRYFGALHDSEPFHIDPLAYVAALAGAAEALGASVHEGTEAAGLSRAGGGWRLMTRSGAGDGAVTARNVVLAGSAYEARLWPPLDGTILPVATYMIATEPLGSRLENAIRFAGCIGDTRRAGDYYRVVGEGDERRLLWGGRITTWRTEPRRLAETLRRDMLSVYPQLGDVQVEHAWSGLMGYTRQRMPVIGELAPGLWAATGFGGHGLNTSAMAGELVGRAIAGGDESWRLFAPFHPRLVDRALGGRNPLGRVAIQATYWWLRARDWWDEGGTIR